MNKLCIILLIITATPLLSFGRLGESDSQIRSRYGSKNILSNTAEEPMYPAKKAIEYSVYGNGSIDFVAHFIDGVSVCEVYRLTGSNHISDADQLAILKAHNFTDFTEEQLDSKHILKSQNIVVIKDQWRFQIMKKSFYDQRLKYKAEKSIKKF